MFFVKGVFMKKKTIGKKYKVLALVSLCVIAVLALGSCGAGTKNVPDAEGVCGSGVTWKYTAADKTLTVSGNGDMTDFASSSEVPWFNARGVIETVKIADGVKNIGSYAFYCSSSLKTVEMTNSVTRIGSYAFALSPSLTSVSLSDTLESVGQSAFEACGALTSIKLPSTLTSLGDRAFALCAKLESAYILGVVEKIGAGTFYNCTSLNTLMLNPAIGAERFDAAAFEATSFDYSKATFATSLDATSTITVVYEYEDGTSAGPDRVFKDLALGEQYSVNTPAIDGFTADILTVSGVANGKDSTVKITYKKNAEVVTEPETTTTVTEAPPVEKGPSAMNYVAIIIMAVIIVGICVAAFFIIRADKKEKSKQQNKSKAKNKKK